MIYPSHFEQKIGFDTVRALLQSHCLSIIGREEAEQMIFSPLYDEVTRRLAETGEMIAILSEEADSWPVSYYFDLREMLSRLRVEGTYPLESELFDLQRSLVTIRDLVQFFARREEERYPALRRCAEGTALFPAVLKRLDGLLNAHGQLRDNASPALAQIRHDLFQVQSGISRTLASILRKAQAEGYVEKDASPAMRDGRLVIPVSPSFKRKVRGIVHDESATGKTVFIEPAEVVEANNRIRELEAEERREKIRILMDFADFVRPDLEELKEAYRVLGIFDFIRAKALFALDTGAIVPRVENECRVEWERAVHPLLQRTLKKQGKSIIPLDITLNEKQRILLISGPNAGGKSVCLKTVGLLQYMLQCGVPVPVSEVSRFGIFDHLFIDIGDEQSIEDDLSTYSSHLLHMKHFIRNSNGRTLLLIDEFGTGTEPMIGGAIAEAVLHRLNDNGAFGVITTHYTNLKQFADSAEGIVNGAMLFDRQHLQPLYKLQIGIPGSSFAIEIARKIGLSEEVIREASDKVGAAHIDLDKYVQDILRDKHYWENKRQQIRQKEKRLEELTVRYEADQSEIKSQRKELLNKAKAEAQALLADTNATIENTIRRIKEAQAEREVTREVRQEFESFRAKLDEQPRQEPNKQKEQRKFQSVKTQKPVEKPKPEPIKAGDRVKLAGHDSVGQVIEVDGVNVTVAFGNLKSTVKADRLEKISRNQEKELTKGNLGSGTSVTGDVLHQRKLNFKQEIDVRGMRGDEALQAVQYFIDDSLMVGAERVRILHGTGTGILRQLIRQYLATIPGVRHFADEHVQLGGAGITVVEL
jgi:DNA mismatch repair protein MutS2